MVSTETRKGSDMKTGRLFTALSLAACTVLTGSFAAEGAMTPGTYEGQAEGRFGTVTVAVTVSEETIDEVSVTEHHDSTGISDLPTTRIPEEIVKYQSLGIDTVTGATITSFGVINAAADALEKAGADVKALKEAPVEYETLAVEDLTADVVVAGSGVAGLTAAASAVSQGADVFVVEKQDYAGGTLIIAGGYLVYADGSKAPEDMDTSTQRVMDFYHRVNEDSVRTPDYDFVEGLVSKSGSATDYFIDTVGLTMEYVDFGNFAMSHHTGNGAGMAAQLKDYIEKNGGTILTGTKATGIIMEDGSAVGLNVENRSGSFNVKAGKTIIATGGSSYDQEALEANNPELETIHLFSESTPGDTGDGAHMMEEAGAQLGNGPYIKSDVAAFPYSFHMDWTNTPSPADKLVVDAEGKRFSNENPLLNYMFNTYLLRHPSPAYYMIYDVAHTDEALLAEIQKKAEAENKNVVMYGSSAEELAEKLEMDPSVFRETFDTYQTACETGNDEEFGKDAEHLIAYDDSEGLYAVYIMPTSLGTVGGALTDENFHVLGKDGEIINNLFAVGEAATSTIFGDYSVGSFSLGLYTTAGMIAGEAAAAELNG